MRRITGNAGLANATVYWYSFSTGQGAITTADGFGNYDIGAVLVDDTYLVFPIKVGWIYTPRYQRVVVSGADVVLNFAAPAAVTEQFTFTQLYEDTFQRPDESPLNPAHWTNAFAPDVSQIVNNECVINLFPTNAQGDSDCLNIARDWTSTTNQFLEITVQDISKGVLYAYLRSGGSFGGADQFYETTPCYRLTCLLGTEFSKIGQTSLALSFSVDQIDHTGGNIPHSWSADDLGQPFPVQVGDRIGFGVIGDSSSGHLYVFLNRVLIFKAALSDAGPSDFIPFGAPGFQLASGAGYGYFTPDPPQSIHDIGMSNFKAGSLAPIVPGTVISCAPLAADNTWQVIYTYPLDAGGIGEALIVVGPGQLVKQWPSLTSTIIVSPNPPGIVNLISLAIPDIVKWAAFGVGNFGGKNAFPFYFLNAQ